MVTKFGKDCWYGDVNTCRADALKRGGMCVYEEDPSPQTQQPVQVYQPPPPPPPQFVDPYLANPLPPQKTYGIRFNEAQEAAMQAAAPTLRILQQDQENKRAEEERRLEMEKQRAEIELLKQQEEYYRSLLKSNEEKQKPDPPQNNSDSLQADWLLKNLPVKKSDSIH